ncbi:tryptophan synthase beta chain 1 [Candidatus Methanoplasma termitum]|uniref:tryptophan synthase n=1 Tax=Candidatus Methanoplasma termitum TaxID=1577791 RepID=A0A0A7LHV3_9ARCH|nr:TrpB-like pyridoxal phosphate-dependent enzyme [Candidatus Methanoplasma termitum]AIZ57076.1 tryptophan synthase beta chain 1 [Candidatus Methanoplasma termitum]
MAIAKDLRISLPVEGIPKKWYNLVADIGHLDPPLNPGTREPAKPEDFEPIFCKEIIRQEGCRERYVNIPGEVREGLVHLNRPQHLQRAVRLEKYLKTPAKIYFKREDMSPLGSHKGNTALAQAYFNAEEGIHTLTTETGAGQWGTALAMVSNLFDIDCTVFMVKGSYNQKPLRKTIMNTYGAKVYASPSPHTEFGKKVLKEHPETTGSLGIAISEACEMAAKDPNTCYSLGSVLNHVMLHQTVIGQETMEQMKIGEIDPDYMIACAGGGSNFGGFCFPMIGEKIKGKTDCEFIAAESNAAPSLTVGEFKYDFGDTAGYTPLLMMYTLGQEFIPKSVHAGGLRYHGMSPLVSAAMNKGLISARAYGQFETFEAGLAFARTEGIVPAPESCHAIKAAMDVALECKKAKKEKTIVFCLSGHGMLDLNGYEQYLDGTMKNSAAD